MRGRSKKSEGAGTLIKGLKILQLLGDYPDGIRFTDLVAEAGLAPSTTHRILAPLENEGFIEFEESTRLYFLGLRVFELSQKVSRVSSAAEIARPVMRELADHTGWTITLNILDRDHMVVLERVDPPSKVHVGTDIGTRETLYSTSTGKVLLASLNQAERKTVLDVLKLKPLTKRTIASRRELEREIEEVAKRGFAIADEENEDNVRALAVLVPSTGGQRCALAMAAPAFVASRETLIQKMPRLRTAAAEIASRLGAGRR
jgi:DNA-binding IclR family transcriptional regulator